MMRSCIALGALPYRSLLTYIKRVAGGPAELMQVNVHCGAASTLSCMVRKPNGSTRDERLAYGVVGNLALFSSLPADALAELALQCHVQAAARGATVLAQGALPLGVLALAYGSVKLVLRRDGGAERVLRVVGASQTLGESSALLGRGSPYEAVALQESKLVAIPAPSLFALLERDFRFARRLVNMLAERKAELYADIQASALLSGRQRVATYLKTLAGAQRMVSLPFSKTLVASRLGIQKETLSRLLRELVEHRVIDMARREIVILEPLVLRELASSDPVRSN